MKTKILTVALTAMMVGLGINSFAQQNKKVAAARKNVAVAKENLKEAKTDSAADYLRFKKEAEANIVENQNNIAKLKARKIAERKDATEAYNSKVLDLEKENNALQTKINAASTTKTDMWSRFKMEFTHDMMVVRRAIEDSN